MLEYTTTQICLTEIPGEISLGINVWGCPIHCEGCHSHELWNIDLSASRRPVTKDVLLSGLKSNPYTTCILFFGGTWDEKTLNELLEFTKRNCNVKTALYTGSHLEEVIKKPYMLNLDYIKVGPYIVGKPLSNANTNQRLFKLENNGSLADMTELFWRNNVQVQSTRN